MSAYEAIPIVATNTAITEPLVSIGELNAWLPGRNIATGDVFATTILNAASLLVRDAGNSEWTPTTVPPRAKLIATLLAKNYYLNPEGILAETTGPLSERKIDDVVRGMVLTDAEKEELAALADKVIPGSAGGAEIYVIPTENLGGSISRPLTRYVYDSNGMLFPWDSPDDNLEPLT